MSLDPLQKQAVTDPSHELLVSASAGTGKTTVLVDRIVYQLVFHPEIRADRLLVLTFTRAAAEEMRSRLTARVTEIRRDGVFWKGDDENELRLTPEQMKQLPLIRDRLQRAVIGTIDSFCGKVAREHFQFAGIDPRFDTLSPTEEKEIFESTLTDTLETVYAAARGWKKAAAEKKPLPEEAWREAGLTPEDAADFAALCDKYRESEIRGMLKALRTFLMSRSDADEWPRFWAEKEYSAETLGEEPAARLLLKDAVWRLTRAEKAWVDQYEAAEALDEAMLAAKAEKEAKSKKPPTVGKDEALFMNLYLNDAEIYTSLREAARTGLQEFQQALEAAVFIKKPSWRNSKDGSNPLDAVNAALDAVRKKGKKLVDDLKKTFDFTVEQAAKDLQALAPSRRGLAAALRLLEKGLSERKKERRGYSFGDIAQIALRVLKDKQLGGQIAMGYDAVFMDECQDVNGLQEDLIGEIREKHPGIPVFYVGDVKQSIYRFRQADPAIFREKQERYERGEGGKALHLVSNFRSASTVLQAVNRQFENIMRAETAEIEYDRNAALTRAPASVGDATVEVHILPKSSSGEAEEEDMETEEEGKDLSRPEDERKEAALIAREIKKLLKYGIRDFEGNPLPVEPKDIMVLLPAMKGIGDRYEQVLRDAGLPVKNQSADNAAASGEILLTVSFLALLENDRNDLRLLTVLRSPLARFTDRDLAQIRLCRNGKEHSFRDALIAYREEGEEPLRSRVEAFFAMLERERFQLRAQPLSEYLWDFLNRTGLLLYYAGREDGPQTTANLRYLCHRAYEWEEKYAAGAERFARMMEEEAAAPEGDLPAAQLEAGNAVKLTTIHRSKGLGEKVVFVAGLGRGFTYRGGRGETGGLSLHRDLGFMPPYRNEEVRTKRDTLLSLAVKRAEERENLAERMRLLYVAMTRAKNKLVLVGTMKDPDPDTMDEDRRKAADARYLDAAAAGTYLDWVMLAADGKDGWLVDPPEEEEFSTENSPEQGENDGFSTSFPQKVPVFTYVFHMNPPDPIRKNAWKDRQKQDIYAFGDEENNALAALWKKLPKGNSPLPFPERKAEADPDPLLPAFQREEEPAKIGVTALLRRETEEAEREETLPVKRLPLEDAPRKILPETPPLPDFLTENAGTFSDPALRGTATHRALELLDLRGLRARQRDAEETAAELLAEYEEKGLMTGAETAQVDQSALAASLIAPWEKPRTGAPEGSPLQKAVGLIDVPGLREQLSSGVEYARGLLTAFVEKGLMTDAEARLVDPRAIARFLSGELCARMLASPAVKREYGFTMRRAALKGEMADDSRTLVQGIIDLCFLEDGEWVLADYKTDRVRSTEELKQRYGAQLEIYRQALEAGTGRKVKAVYLYSLYLGELTELKR